MFDEFQSLVGRHVHVQREGGQCRKPALHAVSGNCRRNSSHVTQCCFLTLKELRKNEDKLPLITLEIRGKHIVQAKGKCNRLPTEKERTVIQLWAKEKALKFIA